MITIGISGINGRVGRVLKAYLEEESGKNSGESSDVKLVAGLSRQKPSTEDASSTFLLTSDYAEFLSAVDIVIDFSLPDHLVTLAGHAAAHKTPLVSGTTGLTTAQMHKIEAAAKITPLLHAGNMSLGVNLLCALVKQSAARLGLEYDLEIGKRGERYSHISKVICEFLGCEDVLIVNNNASAVFLVLNTFAKNKEAIVSRGELVEIGGSFRVPDVMASSGAILKEIGTTNKTHLRDYDISFLSDFLTIDSHRTYTTFVYFD